MFTKLLNSIIYNENNYFKKKKNIYNYIILEIWYFFKKLFNNFSKINEKKYNKLNAIIAENDPFLLQLLQNKLKHDINKNLFHIREEFIEVYFNNINILFLKKEWSIFYTREIDLHTLWLIYNQRPFYIFGANFYFRYKKIFNLFKNSSSTGKYTQSNKLFYKNIYFGFISFWNALKIWLFSLVILFISFYILLIKRVGVLPQTLFFWVSLIMLLYWLLSGFVFFVKKYQYSRFTSVIQRFWRRSYILFWLIESGLLLVFFYLTINSSQESFYMFDQGHIFKTHLFSWKLFLFKCILVVTLIIYSYLLLLNLKWSIFNKNIFQLIFLTLLLIYFVWIEFYQIYWVSNFYANFSWFYDVEEIAWTLEFDGRRTRILNHYIMILYLLKFWHIIFIFGCWIFFLLRANELDVITYPLYSFNFQNFIILFIMTWLFMYPWLKHTYHWLAEIPYYWFYVDTHISFYKILINDIYYFYYNYIKHLFFYKIDIAFYETKFINWFLIDSINDHNIFIKYTIKNEILKKLI